MAREDEVFKLRAWATTGFPSKAMAQVLLFMMQKDISHPTCVSLQCTGYGSEDHVDRIEADCQKEESAKKRNE